MGSKEESATPAMCAAVFTASVDVSSVPSIRRDTPRAPFACVGAYGHDLPRTIADPSNEWDRRTDGWYDGIYGTAPESWARPDGLIATVGEVSKATTTGQSVAVHVRTEEDGSRLRGLLIASGVPLDNVCIAPPPKAGAERCPSCDWHVVGTAGHRAWCERGARRIVGSR
jgi:hypothetical protein